MNTKQIEKYLARIQGELDKFKALIADKEWRDGDEFYYISSVGGVVTQEWNDNIPTLQLLKEQGNIFKTREEAEARRDEFMDGFLWGLEK